ncbi:MULTISPECIES: aldo/keto reductase [unclassified Rathayibacter]|uniref:aldo/keto reductase n=1 Tax=unclassified Rathayibacter TaxID=2609250 RepID=UPI000FA0B820|nr:MULTISPECIES: aldo/keto reductase [unclassified Rathayibacter]ROP49160.1 aryl-alcohol dehydrogenase-like predicted oxidoreductase [Rathayibacter sp. PhB186]ROS50723.1 aryl-alcohol dehydrogenase-like predicted oxidoreductase [Rathayibacter sp. PhB185]
MSGFRSTSPERGLEALPPYVYGTTRLGDVSIPRTERTAMARSVLERGLWLHTSDQYGDALAVLGEAIADLDHRPSTIVKIGGGTAEDVRAAARAHTRALGIDTITLGQLSPVEGLDNALVYGDRTVLDGLRALRADGLVGGFALEVFPWTSAAPLAALRAGHLDDLVDAVILYLNPLQRFATNALWDELVDRRMPLISMRTVAGNDVFALRDVPGAAWRPYLRDRAVEVAPLYERSGAGSWTEFCIRYALSQPGARSTVGSTLRADHLNALLDAANRPVAPLPEDIAGELDRLHRRWSNETDIHAEPWTM